MRFPITLIKNIGALITPQSKAVILADAVVFVTKMIKRKRKSRPVTKVDHHGEICHICKWTNVNLINLGEPNKPKWTCHGCCKRMLDVIEPPEEE